MVDTPELLADEAQRQALAETIQRPPEVSQSGAISAALSWGLYARGSFLPPYGTRERERSLNALWHMDEMALIRGAGVGIAKNIATLPWEIKGDDTPSPLFREMAKAQGLRADNGVEYYQQAFRHADFGEGWGAFIAKLVTAFLRFDGGGFFEVIAPGDPYGATEGAITGLAYLDPLRCLPTGDPRFPVIYYDRFGGMHVMHHTRVGRLQDMSMGEENAPGYGDCALSRAVSIAYRQIWMARYINAFLDDQPQPGVMIVGGVSRGEWDAVEQKYERELNADKMGKWGRVMRYHTAGANVEPKIESKTFQQAPEKFNFREYMELDVDLLALVLGVDRQELWQLSGGNIGSAEQSAILHQKSRGKTIGFLITQIERKLNDLLPVDYEFAFKYRDESEAIQEAQKANLWADFVSKTTQQLNPQESKTLLNNQVEAVADAITTAPRVNDTGLQPQDVVTAPDDTPGTDATITPVPAQTAPAAPDETTGEKAYTTTESQFLQALRKLTRQAIEKEGVIGRVSFGMRMRNLLKDYGLQAYKDGMAQGGVFVDELDPEEENDYISVFIDQAQYITGFDHDLYVSKTITLDNVDHRVTMWGKSLQAFLDSGRVKADANGMFLWEVGNTEHCPDCLRLNGQVHRMKTWYASGWLPRASLLSCKGYKCQCRLVKTNLKARGRF